MSASAAGGGPGFLGGAFVEIVVRIENFAKALRKAKNMFTKAVNAIRKAARRLGSGLWRRASRATDKFIKKLRFLRRLATRFGLPLLIGAGLLGGKMIKDAIEAFAEFDQKMADIRAIAPATAAEFKAMEEAARDFGRTTIFTAAESAGALEVLRKMGLSVADSIGALGPSLQLASAGGITIAEAAGIAGGVMKTLGLEAKDLARINDVLAKAAASSRTTISDLGKALPQVLAVARQTGVSLETVVAVLGRMQDAGIDAAIAGTSLRNVLLILQAGSKQQEKALRDAGVQLDKFRDGTIDFLDVINQLAKSKKFFDAPAEFFGRRGGPQISAGFLASGGEEAAKSLAKLAHSLQDVGFAARAERERLNSLRGTLTLLKSAFNEVQITFGETFKDGITLLSNALKGESGLFRQIKAALVTLKPVVDAIFVAMTNFTRGFTNFLERALPTIKKLGLFLAAAIHDPIGALKAIWEVIKGGFNFVMAKIKAGIIALVEFLTDKLRSMFATIVPEILERLPGGIRRLFGIDDEALAAMKKAGEDLKASQKTFGEHFKEADTIEGKGFHEGERVSRSLKKWEDAVAQALFHLGPGLWKAMRSIPPPKTGEGGERPPDPDRKKKPLKKEFAEPGPTTTTPVGGGTQSGIVSFLQDLQRKAFGQQTQEDIKRNTGETVKAVKEVKEAVEKIKTETVSRFSDGGGIPSTV